MSLFCRLAAERRPTRPERPAPTQLPTKAPTLFRNFRRAIMFGLVQPGSFLFHQEIMEGTETRSQRNECGCVQHKGLSNCDAPGDLVHDDAGVAVPLLGLDDVGEVVRRNFAVGVEDIDQQLFLPAASGSGQIRPDRESITAEAVAGLTTLLEYGLAALVVAAQIESGQKTTDYFVAPGIRRGADQLDGALLEGWIRVLPQGHPLQQGQIATLDNASRHRTEQPAGAVGALEPG